jgi:GDP-L-fucose synthase
MNRILVTGSEGLVGSHIKNMSIGLTSKNCDLRNKEETEEYFNFYLKNNKRGHEINGIVHCAGKVGGLGSNMKYKGEFFYDNIMINTNVIESARKAGITNLVCFLSTCIFPDKIGYPLYEYEIHLGPPHESNYGYAYAKRMAEVQIRAYREQYGLNYKCVIPTNIYGPNDNFNLNDGHVIPSLIHKCYIAKRDNTPFVIWGSGRPLREFIYVKDIAELTEWVLYNYNENEPIILSTSKEVSIKDVATLIVELMEFKGDVIWDRIKPDGQFRKPSNNNKIKKYLPDFEFTPLRDGLKETIDWFNKNYPNIRK